ncbi:MAG: helix-turn-helix domain-containing protein [Kiritimatiellaeota bacterium]|nr:helix-turn-helix domain-containing protein [Kiritimatiellota bacterium]
MLDEIVHTSESVLMDTAALLQPTLWRTCRVLANRTRLEMYRLLLRQPGQTVTAVAQQLHQPLSLTSEYLRALEARGLLTVRRVGRRVVYGPRSTSSPKWTSDFAAALRATFRQAPRPLDTIYRLTTAFTHPRRVELFRALQQGPRTPAQLRAGTRISVWALRRQLKKLETRGFVTQRNGMFAVMPRQDSLGRALARLATS